MIRVARVVTAFAVSLVFVLSASFASAGDSQYGPYGPSPVHSIVLDKMVNRPGTSDYVDNLSPSDPRFATGQDVWFKIKVKNPHNETLHDVTVKDFIPEFLDIIETPGSYDSGSRTITINAGNFGGQEEKIYSIKARVVGENSLPDGITCRLNRAQAYNSKVSDEDTSQFCVEKTVKQVTTITTIPATGPEMGLALLALNAFGFGVGMRLRKKS